ncbi:MAG: hypothetical protein R2817_13070 [Flavobacteriales bacterium]
MKRLSLLCSLLLVAMAGHAQMDTVWVPYSAGMDLRDGLYRSFHEFRLNAPGVAMERLRDDQGLPVRDLRKVMSRLYWQPDSGAREAIRPDRMWGFCQNDVIYVSAGNGFYRIGLMGSIAHLVVEVSYRDWDPYMQPFPVTRTALVHQLLDMRTGAFLPFTSGGMSQALQGDPVLLEEFLALSPRERNKDAVLFRFLHLHNERNALLLPK